MSSSTNTSSQVLTMDNCISTENVEHDTSHDNAPHNLVVNLESSHMKDDDDNYESYKPEIEYYREPDKCGILKLKFIIYISFLDCNCEGAYGYDDEGQIIHDIDCSVVGMKEDHFYNHGEGGGWYRDWDCSSSSEVRPVFADSTC